MANLLEQYKTKIAVAENVYAKSHNGAKLDNMMKLVTAKCLNNIDRYMNEAFENSTGTQKSALGDYKRFALALTTLAVPNLIAPELVMVQPMSSTYGYVTYLNFVAGSKKGGVAQGDLFNGVYALGQTSDARTHYTSDAITVAEQHIVTAAEASALKVKLDWTPATALTQVKVGDTTKTIVAPDAVLAAGQVKLNANSEVEFYTSEISATNVVKVLYSYDNVFIPQNDLPIYNAELKSIALEAKARRLAIYYSQMAAFQAKTDYGFDLGNVLAEQAVGELAFEIDSEVVALLSNSAEVDSSLAWSKTLPVGVSKVEHYQGFAEVVEIAKAIIYKRTGKFSPNWMLIAANILPVITFINGWQAAPAGAVNGPYFAGTLNGIKVFVSPAMVDGDFVLGVNGHDMQTAAAVYAPYMPIVPTQLLQYADGGNSQGFSTLYDLKLLSTYVGGDTKTYSPLLVKGQVSA